MDRPENTVLTESDGAKVPKEKTSPVKKVSDQFAYVHLQKYKSQQYDDTFISQPMSST